MSVAAVLLVAGAGSRFGGSVPKPAALLRGRPLVAWAVSVAVEAEIGPVIVVSGAVDVASLLDPDLSERVHVVDNPDWASGQATSLQVALLAAAEHDCRAVVVGLGDQPFLDPVAWRRVAFTPGPIVIATYDGRRGHPVKLDESVWPALPVTGDGGARALMAERPDLVVEVACDGNPADIDTVEDLARWS